ncbi:putative metal-binding protein [Sporomusaceae bacterium BoRhaA]|jgi:predicted metal-binding protein|uniref:CGGC domain-containing protein n=1 Tax=Pelorhabdus rhamnosifermentans TaxID=2772457 RepID=UPI001C0603E1|nr:CGGC domain-containing protein [Pelorhabdus rhamnosifermentans]MBU2702720.1 putative metal-binding protein [Pelorhabdus rhamnosifermentans]
MSTKYVVIIQCDIAHKRCSGFACTNAFYNKDGVFKDYDNTVRYISFTCGGCCGKGVAAKLEHFSKKLAKKSNITKDEVVVHLSSCMVTENHHSTRCPHADYIRNIVAKKGYKSVVEGSYISAGATRKREEGIYSKF